MSFKDEIFPTGISYGAIGGPAFVGSIVESQVAGNEHRALLSSMPRFEFDVAHAARTQALAATLTAFFMNMNGAYHSFRYFDHLDYSVDASEGVFTAIDATHFQMMKRYTFGSQNYNRKITKPVSSASITGGTGVSVDYATGIVTVSSGTPTSWTGTFHVHARFADWAMQRETISRQADGGYIVGWRSCRVVEIKAAA